jgi:putative transposase
MIILEFRLAGKPRQFNAIDEAIRTTQFIRNKCVRYWQDTRGIKLYDLNKYCASLAEEPLHTTGDCGVQARSLNQESQVL